MKIEIKTEGLIKFIYILGLGIILLLVIVGLVSTIIFSIERATEKTTPIHIIPEKTIVVEKEPVIVKVDASKTECIAINGEIIGDCEWLNDTRKQDWNRKQDL